MNMEWPCANRVASGFMRAANPLFKDVKDHAGQKPGFSVEALTHINCIVAEGAAYCAA